MALEAPTVNTITTYVIESAEDADYENEYYLEVSTESQNAGFVNVGEAHFSVQAIPDLVAALTKIYGATANGEESDIEF